LKSVFVATLIMKSIFFTDFFIALIVSNGTEQSVGSINIRLRLFGLIFDDIESDNSSLL